MTKEKIAGAAPVSKYAAKRNARVKTALENEKLKNVQKVEFEQDEEEQSNIGEDLNNEKQEVFSQVKPKFGGKTNIPTVFPEHVVQIALLIKNNAEIRRFTALGILNYLLQKGEIQGEKRYVAFKWNKFAVKANGLMREYSYGEPFFLNALVAAFSSFSASAQRTIDSFCRKEMSISISKAVNQEEIDDIVNLNEQYQGGVETSED